MVRSAYAGDTTLDGNVDIVDLVTLAGNWLAGGGGGGLSFEAALQNCGFGNGDVPEPVILSRLPGLNLLGRRRR